MSMKREAEEARQTACDLWRYMGAKEWEKARALLADDFEADWPQSKERIVGADNFIELNRRYPGQHEIRIMNSMVEYQQWDLEFLVSTQVYIDSKMPDGSEVKLYGVSFFRIDLEEQIMSAIEYWGDTYEPPEWRKDLVERY